MSQKCVKCGKDVDIGGNATFVHRSGPDTSVICDGCSGEQRDANGNCLSVMRALQQSMAVRLILLSVLIVAAIIIWAEVLTR